MWSYYGAKTNIVDHYPPPKFDKVIEPFAGTARYALKYFEKEVLLVDKYNVIINIWKWLQKCSISDINSLPHHIAPGQDLNDLKFDCQEAKDLIGFLIGFGMQMPRKKATIKRMTVRPNHVNYSLKKIAKSLFKIRHWDIQLGTYQDVPNEHASWFIDPPYQFGGEAYIHSSKKIDFTNLGSWAKSRRGHTIVCENTKADWMDFQPMTTQKGSTGMQSEAIWSNYPTAFDHQQLEIFE